MGRFSEVKMFAAACRRYAKQKRSRGKKVSLIMEDMILIVIHILREIEDD